MRCLWTMLLCLAAFSLPAWERIPPTASRIHVHHRVPAEPGADFILKVADSDTSSCRFFKATLSHEADYDMFNRNFVNFTIGHADSCSQVVDSTLVFPLYNDGREQSGLSFRLSLISPGRLKLEFGETEPLFTFPINSDGKDLFFETYFDGKGDVLRHDSEIVSFGNLRKCSFSSVKDLYSYLAATSDPLEGVWTHYDQDSPSLRVSSARRYTFAVVSAGQGKYEIILLDVVGADVKPLWQPLAVKACFSETGFTGIYNLEWLDIAGRPVDTDATLQTTGGNMLSLRFPYWDTTVRYVKTELQK